MEYPFRDCDDAVPTVRQIIGGNYGRSTVACIVVVSLYVFPAVYLFANAISLVAITNESLSYRYFYSLRISELGGDGLFLPQGQTLTVFHHALHWVLTTLFGLRSTDLGVRLDVFGYATLALNGLIGAIGLAIGLLHRALRPVDKAMLASLALIYVYGSRSGMSAATTPDYYGFEASLTLLFVAMALIVFRRPNNGTNATVFGGIGLLAAIAVGVKITLLASAVLPLLMLVMRDPAWQWFLARRLVVFFGAALAGVVFILLASYAFDVGAAFGFFGLWSVFVGNPGGEAGFWASLLEPGSPEANTGASYGYALFLFSVCMPTLLFAALRLLRVQGLRGSGFLFMLALLVLVVLHIAGLVRRPAGTTLWEITLFLTAASVLALTLAVDGRRLTLLGGALAAVFTAQAAYSAATNFGKFIDIEAYADSTRKVWQAHAYFSAHPGRKIFIIPDNNHTAGSVEEALLKGMSDLPSWNIASGKPLLAAIAPGLSIVREPMELKPDDAVMWIDIVDKESLARRFAVLGTYLDTGLAPCRSWDIATWEWWRRRIVVCRPGD